MRAIIVDDEPAAADYLLLLCMQIPDVEVTAQFYNAFDALDYLNNHPVELALLDIEMPGMRGIDAISKMRAILPELAVVFVTGYDQYALPAFQADAVSYLLKPCDANELSHAVEKVRRLSRPTASGRILVHTFGSFDLFIDNTVYRFANSKAKELLALLIDRCGGVVSMEQVISLLWEERPYDETVKQLYRKAVIYLHSLCREKNLDFFVSNRGSCHILVDRLQCDYYRFLEGSHDARQTFDGEYLSEYSWAEQTLAKLCRLQASFE